MSPKYRLPTWRLCAKKTLRLETTPNCKWHGVATGILNDSARDPYWAESNGGKKSAPTFTASLLGVFLLLTSGSGRLNFYRYWRSSVGWILCWDDADSGDYVADVSMVMLVLTAGLYRCRVWKWHIFQLSLIIVALRRPYEERLNSLFTVSDIYRLDHK